jgi:hypothetical protein
MIQNKKQPGRNISAYLFAGLFFSTVALLSPDAGTMHGTSFFSVAQASPWERWWDWPAAWCSLKIILLSVGVFLSLFALMEFLRLSAKNIPSKIVMTLTTAPVAGFWLGVYYFVKALF